MSFILEALKKSEQQRQQKSTSPQKVRKRTLSTASSRSDRRPYWIAAGFLPLILLSGWLLYSGTEAPLEQPPAANKTRSSSPLSQPMAAQPTGTTPAVASPPQKPVVAAASAPVPRNYISPPATSRRAPTTVSANKAAEKPPEPDVEPRDIDELPLEPISTHPLYLDLSRELRDQMPHLTMSLHFYTTNRESRLVRINNHLLHEDDWVNRDLQIVEITPTGVTLDFMGKLFEMRNSSR